MQTSFFLTVSRKGAQKVTQTAPTLKADEIAMYVTLELPNSLFERPLLQAHVKLPQSLSTPEPLSVEVQETVVANLRQATGLDVRLVVELPEAPAEPGDPQA